MGFTTINDPNRERARPELDNAAPVNATKSRGRKRHVDASVEVEQTKTDPPGFDARKEAEKLNKAMKGWGTDERAIFDVLWSGRPDLNLRIQKAHDAMYDKPLLIRLKDELTGKDETRALRLLSHGELSIKDKLKEACQGWGTDEGKIFDSLDRASPEEIAALKADQGLVLKLRKELNDDDWLLVKAYLDGEGIIAGKLRRAVRGWGTDEAAIWAALEKASVSDKAFILKQPRLMKRLKQDLGSRDEMRLLRMLRGQLTNIDRIEVAMKGWGTDEDMLKQALRDLTATELFQIPDHVLEKLDKEVGGDDQLEVDELLHQKRMAFDPVYKAKWTKEHSEKHGDEFSEHPGRTVLSASAKNPLSAVARLRMACRGMGTDDEAVWAIVGALNKDESEFILKYNPEDILGKLRKDLGTRYERLVRALEGGSAGSSAMLQQSIAGFGTDEQVIYRTIERILADGHASEILNDKSLLKRVRWDISKVQYQVFISALRTGKFDAKMRMKFATMAGGTDEDLVFEICEKYRNELLKDGVIDSEIEAMLKDDLSPRDYWSAIDLIRGEPKNHEERVARAKEKLERERGGLSTALMDRVSVKGEHADDAWREYNASHNKAHTDGKISEAEVEKLNEDELNSLQKTDEYRQAKATVAQWATQIAVAIVGIAATILTAGAAGPFIAGIAASMGGTVAVTAEAMVLAAALKVGLNKAILGEGYDLKSYDTLVDAVGASIEAGLYVVGNLASIKMFHKATKLSAARAVAPAVEKTFGRAGKRIIAGGLENAIDGTLGGVGEGMFYAMTREDTWSGDMGRAFGLIFENASYHGVMGAATGGALGGAMRGVGEFAGPAIRAKFGDIKAGDSPGRLKALTKAPGQGAEASKGGVELPGMNEIEGPASSRHNFKPQPYKEDGGWLSGIKEKLGMGGHEKPIRITQDDPLPALRETHAKTAKYEDFEDGKAFLTDAKGNPVVDANSVKQGALGDCYLIAGCAAVARADPSQISKIIKDNGNGTFDVTLYLRENWNSAPVPVTRTIDARLPTRGSQNPIYAGLGAKTDEGEELWTALIEKRLAQETGSYDFISGGNINKHVKFAGVTELLTGKGSKRIDFKTMDDDKLLGLFDTALKENRPIQTGTVNMEDLPDLRTEAGKWNVFGNHAYAVESVDLDSKTVNLQNPWGTKHVRKLSMKDFKRFYDMLSVGEAMADQAVSNISVD